MNASIFIHGLEGSSQGFKACYLRQKFPWMLIPDFKGTFSDRLTQLEAKIDTKQQWILVGSSLGGSLAIIYTLRHRETVKKLILLAPAINFMKISTFSTFDLSKEGKIQIPTVVYHGKRDNIVPIMSVQPILMKFFEHLIYNIVDDDHKLHATTEQIPWESLII
jgi:pimeloyl-ACP methyl ester carboxylesterase